MSRELEITSKLNERRQEAYETARQMQLNGIKTNIL